MLRSVDVREETNEVLDHLSQVYDLHWEEDQARRFWHVFQQLVGR